MCWQRGHLLQDRSPALSGQHPPSQPLETTSLLLPPHRCECQQPLPSAGVLDLGPALSPSPQTPGTRESGWRGEEAGHAGHVLWRAVLSGCLPPCLPSPHLEAEKQGRQTTEGQLTSSPSSSTRTQCVSFHLTFRERRRQQDVLSFLALGIHSVEDHREVLFKTQIQDSVVSRKEF